jgi:AcrR family transcriptional regulator
MPAPRKRPSTKAEQRRVSIERILDAALGRFLSRGYHSTSVDDIAKDAGVTKGAVYFYFESKSAVMFALLDEIEGLVVEGLLARLEKAGPSAQDQLVAAIHSQGAIAADRSRYLILFTIAMVEFAGTGDPIEQRLRAVYARFQEAIEKIAVRGQRTGEFSANVRARELTAIILALEHGTLLEWYFRSGTLDGAELVRAARTVLLGGVMQKKTAAAKKRARPVKTVRRPS